VRLLRVLETGEFIKVGSSKMQKSDVRVIAATNVDILQAIQEGKFREDLFYRLNTVPVIIPALRERSDDILLLFRKFAADFAEKYRMPSVKLTDDARAVLTSYNWPGNVRQLKNITEQISIIEGTREIDTETLKTYLPDYSGTKLPAVIKGKGEESFSSEREILYKILFDMKKDMTDLKKLVLDMMHANPEGLNLSEADTNVIRRLYDESESTSTTELAPTKPPVTIPHPKVEENIQDTEEIIEESLSLVDKEIELIKKALEKYAGKRKLAADELGISERTLYRKIKEYGIDL
jgi:transcriptional regulator with PAS, ATPase and Fis domain